MQALEPFFLANPEFANNTLSSLLTENQDVLNFPDQKVREPNQNLTNFGFLKKIALTERSKFKINSDKCTSWQTHTLTYVTRCINQEILNYTAYKR